MVDNLSFVLRKTDVTSEDFERLLSWLDCDRTRAGDVYERIRQRLIRIFIGRGAAHAEDLADETMNRVIGKLPQIIETYTGDPALYFYGVANHVHREYVRTRNVKPAPLHHTDEADEDAMDCLEGCLAALSPEQRDLVLQYYATDGGRTRIEDRRRLAVRMGVSPTALRIRAHRVRATLERCVTDCLRRGGRP